MNKIILILGLLIAISLGVAGFYRWAYNRGKSDCKSDYQIALQEAQYNAYKAIKNIEQGYDNASQKIRSISSNSCLGDASRYSIKWLHEHYNQ